MTARWRAGAERSPLVARGLTDAAVATQLLISPRTVQRHLSAIYGKLAVSTRTAAARIAIAHGLV
jgi:DNA-binding NarL/FixJ family response regulator